MSFVLALDQGTTSSRALVFDHAGVVRAAAQQEFRQIFPQPGWVEHDAGEIWATQSGVMHEALARAGSGARHRRDRHHEPARDDGAVGARHRPAGRQRDRLAGPAHGAACATRCAPPGTRRDRAPRPDSCSTRTSPAPSSSGCSTTCRGARARAARRTRLRHDRLLARLESHAAARSHVTDPSNASRTLLFDIHAGDWDDELLALFDVPRSRAAARRAVVGRLRAGDGRRRRRARSPASPATSRRRCSGRPAMRPGSRRTPTAPAASCC